MRESFLWERRVMQNLRKLCKEKFFFFYLTKPIQFPTLITTKIKLPKEPESTVKEYAIDLDVYDRLSNSRIKKFDVVEAHSEEEAIKEARWKYGEAIEIEKIYLF